MSAVTQEAATTEVTLSKRLQTETGAQHQRMHGLMVRANPFADVQSYAKFVQAQYLFQRDVEFLFSDERLKQLVPDLDIRGRQEAALQDLKDIGADAPADIAIATSDVVSPEALGWLYVSEGSTLGAAFLFKEAGEKLGLTAEHGARNLAAYPEGRAKAWKSFVNALNESGLSQEEQDRVVAGANAAYDRFGDLLTSHYQLA